MIINIYINILCAENVIGKAPRLTWPLLDDGRSEADAFA
jgi:hypothetical protein